MATDLTRDKPALRFSFDALSAIEELERCQEFSGFFLKGLQAMVDGMADQVLHDPDLGPEERERIRQRRLGILDAIQWMPSEKSAHERILSDHGVTRGDELPG
jgi:hypothetical protein